MPWQAAGMATLILAGAPIAWRTLRDAVRGRFATDIVATLAIVTAAVLREPVAGLVIVLMRTGGEFLERFAARRASRALQELEDASPHSANRVRADGVVEEVAAERIVVGDVLLVRPGELVPTDGVVVDGESSLDVSRLTGESRPLPARAGVALMSGSINGYRPLHVRATARATESQYARIVELVRSAQATKAPLQRLADRYAVWFTPFTLAVCALTFALTRDWQIVLAVLVVATPCPLILAAPVAIVGGISHAARHGIIVRHGGALESLGAVSVAVFDKTGTLTVGRPSVSGVMPQPPWNADSVIRLAAAVEQGSSHTLARSIVSEAQRRNGAGIPSADSVVESPGRGVVGLVGEHRVAVGSPAFVDEVARVPQSRDPAAGDALRSLVAIDGRIAGTIEFADELRPNTTTTLSRLRRAGVARIILLSGDQQRYVDAIARRVGIHDGRGDMLPEDKLNAVARLKRSGDRVLMVGDGVNDAPALSAADVGIALAGRGRGIATESADVILLEDEFRSVADAVEIGRKTMRVARQSIVVGLALSAVAMVFAASGAITPVVGALIQEGIDVAVIVNALRTSR